MGRIIKRRIKDELTLERELLGEAGIEDEVEVKVEKGRIILMPVLSEKGWDLLRQLGKDAVEGRLENASERHNEYLYSRVLR